MLWASFPLDGNLDRDRASVDIVLQRRHLEPRASRPEPLQAPRSTTRSSPARWRCRSWGAGRHGRDLQQRESCCTSALPGLHYYDYLRETGRRRAVASPSSGVGDLAGNHKEDP
ncbi:hypothetical protein MCOR25_001602 [Pyricularia grisea]|nr:hypothetical protein MCOR25_001602 [Pyricularia grisea]